MFLLILGTSFPALFSPPSVFEIGHLLILRLYKEEVRCRIEETCDERWGAGVETQKNVRGEIGGWGRVPFNEPYAPLLSTIYDGP